MTHHEHCREERERLRAENAKYFERTCKASELVGYYGVTAERTGNKDLAEFVKQLRTVLAGESDA